MDLTQHHDLFDEIVGAAGVSQQLYALLGHGRWTKLFHQVSRSASARPVALVEDGMKLESPSGAPIGSGGKHG